MTTRQRLPRNGKTAREVAEKTGLSVSTIMRWTAQPREDYLAEAATRRQRIHALRAEGLSMRAIAEREGVTVGAVHYALHKQEETAQNT